MARCRALLTLGLATTLLGPTASRVPPDLRVPLLVRQLSWLLPEPSPTVVVRRPGAPQLPVPRDLAMVAANTARTYDADAVAGVPGTPEGTITIQRFEQPDGTVSWLVAIPVRPSTLAPRAGRTSAAPRPGRPIVLVR